MKVLYFFILIFLSSLTLRAQWSTDPNNNLIVGYGLDPHICSDSAGGCYITYDYENIYYPRKLALERLDKYGYKPWGTLKQILGESPQQYRAKIIEDGEGGVIISYIDRYENLPNWTQRVRVQRVDSSGNFLWGQIGIRVTLENINQGDHHLVTDGNGGCVIAWQNVNYLYFINRIDRDGNRLWGDNGITLNTGGSNSQPIVIKAADGNYYLQAGTIIYRINQNGEILNQFSSTILGQPVPDPDGGVVVSGFIGNIYNRKLVSHRKDLLGNNLWQEPYVEIADSLHTNTQLRIQNIGNYFYFGWSGRKEGVDQVAQFQTLRLDGSILFVNGSIAFMNRQSSLNSIVQSDLSRTIFIYWNHPSLPDSTLAQVYDTLGNKIWDEQGVLVGHPAISSQSFTTDGRSGFIIGGTINEFTIVAQQVSKYGNLGEIITNINVREEEIIPSATVLFQNYPNPFNPATVIKYDLPTTSAVSLIIYDILGRKVKELVNTKQLAGRYEVKFDATNLASGVYIYKLVAEKFISSKKMILLK
ncbi:MAG TPA: T9SS type A sorting domain-containing protein [Ignavibacteriaceae bacterium]|nr:T9SS type A sorting domain-containing protein [Ignavibacteriaceae bacterium]